MAGIAPIVLEVRQGWISQPQGRARGLLLLPGCYAERDARREEGGRERGRETRVCWHFPSCGCSVFLGLRLGEGFSVLWVASGF